MSPVNVPAIGAFIREQREQAKVSLRQLAQAAGVSNPYLSQIERGLRRPSADILQQIAKGLRISAEALYVQAGFLEDRPAGPGVRDAVLADPDLTERQKQMLLEVYESFRKESAESGRTVLVGETVPPDEPGPGAIAAAGQPAEAKADAAAPGQPADADAAPPGQPGGGGRAEPRKPGRAAAARRGAAGRGENVPPGGPGKVA